MVFAEGVSNPARAQPTTLILNVSEG